jgi:hypothetical protein
MLQGCNRTSLHCVPLYDTLGEKAIEYVMTHSETKFVVAAGSKLAGLAKSLKGFSGKLLGVAYWGPAPEEAKNVSCCCCWCFGLRFPQLADVLQRQLGVSLRCVMPAL